MVLPGVPSRFEDGLIEAVRRVRAGDVGRPLTARVFVNHAAMTSPQWQRDTARSGGPLGEFGTYGFDIVRWVLGTEPEEVFAYGENFMHKGEIESWDNVKALVRFGDGSLGSVHVCTSISWEYPFFDLEVVGEEGCLRTDYHNYPVVTQGEVVCAVGAYSLRADESAGDRPLCESGARRGGTARYPGRRLCGGEDD